MDEKKAEEIKTKLDILIILQAREFVKDQSKTDAILFLNRIGLDNQLISKIVETSASAVAVRISESKKMKKRKNE